MDDDFNGNKGFASDDEDDVVVFEIDGNGAVNSIVARGLFDGKLGNSDERGVVESLFSSLPPPLNNSSSIAGVVSISISIRVVFRCSGKAYKKIRGFKQ